MKRRAVWLILLVGVLAVAAALQIPWSEERALKRIDRIAKNTVEDGHWPSISLAYVAPGEVLWAQSYGMADIDGGRAMTADTPMPIGSISKVIIGLTAAIEAQAGRFDPNAPLSSYWPDAPGSVADLTFTQLATHTSGLRDTDRGYEEAAYAQGVLTHPTALEPFLLTYLEPEGALFDGAAFGEGGEYEYSNVGAAIAALALEKAQGTDFATLSEDLALRPAGLAGATWDAESLAADTRAQLYQGIGDGFVALDPYALATWPDGGLNASLNDLARLLSIYLGQGRVGDEQLLEADVIARQTTPAYEGDENSEGLFWAYEKIELPLVTLDVEGHSGGDPGLLTMMYRVAGTDRGFVIMVNGYHETEWTLVQAARLFVLFRWAAEAA